MAPAGDVTLTGTLAQVAGIAAAGLMPSLGYNAGFMAFNATVQNTSGAAHDVVFELRTTQEGPGGGSANITIRPGRWTVAAGAYVTCTLSSWMDTFGPQSGTGYSIIGLRLFGMDVDNSGLVKVLRLVPGSIATTGTGISMALWPAYQGNRAV